MTCCRSRSFSVSLYGMVSARSIRHLTARTFALGGAMRREIQVLVGMSCFAMYANSNVSRSFYCAACVKKCDGLVVLR